MVALNSKGKSMMIIVVIVAVAVMLAGVGIVAKSKMGGKSKAKDHTPAVEMPLGEFVVNLADTSEIRYLKANIVLGVKGEVASSGGGHGGEGGGPDSKIRDAVITVLSSKCYADINKPDGKEKLKKDIMAAVNKRLEGAKAVDVYFNEFAMQ